jgi:hypothetical protein
VAAARVVFRWTITDHTWFTQRAAPAPTALEVSSMVLPSVTHPERYRGLYVYDFGQWCAIGYTAEEIAILLEDQQTSGGQVYRIHRAQPDGTIEIAGVSTERFGLESGMFFYRADGDAARADYEQLAAAADGSDLLAQGASSGAHNRRANGTPNLADDPARLAAPCRARLELADRGDNAELYRYVVSLVYPSEYDAEISAWLCDIDYSGGDVVEGGISPVAEYLREQKTVLERTQVWGKTSVSSRSPSEVLASTHRAVQR